MNLKLKFSLLLCLLVSVVLISCISVIYLLYANTRKEAYINRLWSKVWITYQHQFKIDSLPARVQDQVDRYPAGFFADVYVIGVDSTGSIFYRSPDTLFVKRPETQLLKEIKKRPSFEFDDGERENVGIYFRDQNCIFIASGWDLNGKGRLEKLRLIMGGVLLGGIVLAAFAAFAYANQAIKPLVKLGNQMDSISANNLKERINVGDSYEELKLIVSNFNDMLDRLDKSFEAQKSFVHHASHELRTPLASMLSQTESALRRNLDNEDFTKVMLSLKEDQQNMIDLTNSLLTLSQYERINYNKEWNFVRLDEILYEAIAFVKKSFSDINITVDFLTIPEDDQSLSIHGSEPLLRSAFFNLLKNAYYYSDNKSVDVILAEDEHSVTLSFLNTGQTLTETETSRLFIPFFRGSNAQGEKGFGLGLPIVNRIVNVHKGEISYSIQNGKNCFKVSFAK